VAERAEKPAGARLNRRNFIGALGAAAAAGALFRPARGGAAAPVLYQDSFGNIGPAAADALAAGIFPPAPLTRAASRDGAPAACSGSCSGGTCVTPGYTPPNILLIMVDQMRWPRWLPGSWNDWMGTPGVKGQFQTYLPNLWQLYQGSFVFSNYFVCATPCTPSRATLLTGLYPQQTSQFVNQAPPNPGEAAAPPLQPCLQGGVPTGFPSIGDVLSQPLLNYQTTWIGKWHVSDNPGQPATDPCGGTTPGMHGPGDYGFNCNGSDQNHPDYNIPGPNKNGKYPYKGGYPSPDSMPNQGNSGEFLGGYYNDGSGQQFDVPEDYQKVPGYQGASSLSPPSLLQLNDAAIGAGFAEWLAAAQAGTIAPPWFTAVSFINSHDISQFPYSFGLTPPASARPACTEYGSGGAYFSGPLSSTVSSQGFQPPPVWLTQKSYPGYIADYPGEKTTIQPLPPLYSVPPDPWNNSDDPGKQAYGTLGGKPGLQTYFQTQSKDRFGEICSDNNNAAWTMFLNYYFWMQSCVDYQIGLVLYGPESIGGQGGVLNSRFAKNTVIIFTSDHGDYGGSHNIHGKSGALYDEIMSVPLWISMPTRSGGRMASPIQRSFVCSSVDVLPFLYTLALGNNSWRCNSSDLIYYLRGRESILDAIYIQTTQSTAPQQRRLSCIPNHSLVAPMHPGGPYPWQIYQPYIFHTMDDFSVGYTGRSPNHAMAIRTVDVTIQPNYGTTAAGQNPYSYGGGKLGIYCYWPAGGCSTWPDPGQSMQFEFYDYTQRTPTLPNGNYLEQGNDAFVAGSGGKLAWTQGAENFLCAFNTYAPGELFDNTFQGNAGLQSAYRLAYQAFMEYLVNGCSPCDPPAPGSYAVVVPAPAGSTLTCPAGCPGPA
jgi:Sulfatase